MSDNPDLIICVDCGFASHDPDLFDDSGDGPICAIGCGPASEGEERPPTRGGSSGTIGAPL